MIFNQYADGRKVRQFSLNPTFLSNFRDHQPAWGPIGYFTYKRTYSRDLPDGGTEEFWQTCQRVVEGCFNIQKIHCNQMGLPWNEQKAQHSAQDMFQRMWEFKFSPPGRGLSVMGTDIVYQRGSASLQNCAFVSSENIAEDFAGPFCFLMDMSMLGVGTGADTKGAGKVKLVLPKVTTEPFVVQDHREGWVDLIRTILNSFVGKGSFPQTIDYSLVRGRGEPLKTFGGTASGPKPLHDLVVNIVKLLLPVSFDMSVEADGHDDWATIGKTTIQWFGHDAPHRITSTQIVDIFNFIGKAVVAGGIRRTAEIMFGEPDDNAFMELKQDTVALNDRRWASNNSVFGYVGMDYTELAQSLAINGEPGLVWLDTAKKCSRLNDPADNKDWRIQGTNPCFAGDTLIAVADGRGAVPISQLVAEGKDVPVYSVDVAGKVEIQWARRPRMTQESASLVEVVLDDGTSLRVTLDHNMRLLDGTTCSAIDLQPGDSLPRFTKELARPAKASKDYWMIYGDTLDRKQCHEFEHRLIARFNDPEKWIGMYDAAQQSGWVNGGLVVHHKDFNPINNAPSNLEILTFRDHQALHALLADVKGDKNPMWGKTHSENTRKKIGSKSTERCKDPAFLVKMSAAQTLATRHEAAERMSEAQKERLFIYYKEQDAITDLETAWLGERLFAVKACEVCKTEMVLPWRIREQSYCSKSCVNKTKEHKVKRIAGQAIAFADKQRQVLHNQVSVLKTLAEEMGRDPLKAEWEARCRDQKVPVRFRTSGTTQNPYALTGYKQLQQVSESYNHRVKEVRVLDVHEPVFNMTVDQNHTLGVVTKIEDNRLSGVFSMNCGEQGLESFELCNLVETYPAHHDSYEDFERTLKMAYLYAKTVTLVPTHDMRANAVMMRNRRIGASMSGIVQAIQKFGRRKFLSWCDNGYKYIQKMDRTYSDWLGVPLSVKTTTVKPSGCLTPDTEVRTNKGTMSLLDLFAANGIDLGLKFQEYREWYPVTGDYRVWDSQGAERRVTKLFVNGVEETFKFTLEDGTVLECTPDHKFLLTDGTWKSAKDLTDQDDLAVR